MSFDEHDERARKLLVENQRQAREGIRCTLQDLIAAEFRKDAEAHKAAQKRKEPDQ